MIRSEVVPKFKSRSRDLGHAPFFPLIVHILVSLVDVVVSLKYVASAVPEI